MTCRSRERIAGHVVGFRRESGAVGKSCIDKGFAISTDGDRSVRFSGPGICSMLLIVCVLIESQALKSCKVELRKTLVFDAAA